MADIDIHCNVIKCRKPLSIETQVCVTSCSHIFCLDCSDTLFSKSLMCPACNTALSQESDDIILTQLNPTEEYKSSVLAGLKPDVVLDICSRAIAFYEYQTSQELAFRAMLQKNTEDKYNSLKGQFDLVTRDIQHIVKVEKEKHKAVVYDYELEKKKSQQIYKKLEEKTKQFQKLKVMYEKLKRKSIAPNIQESFIQQQQQPMTTITPSSRNNNHIMSFSNHQEGNSATIFDNNSRIERSSIAHPTARSVFIPPSSHQKQQINFNNIQQHHQRPPTSSRIPSPVKSIYSVRSNYTTRFIEKESENNNQILQQQQKHHHHLSSRHHHHPPAPSEP